MNKSGISPWQKGLLISLVLFVFLCLIGRNNYPLGILLILGRWILILNGLVLLLFLRKKLRNRNWLFALCASIFLLLGEAGWNKWNEYKTSDPVSPQDISLMTYNLFFRNKAPEMAFEVIERQQPDILLVQELTAELEKGLDKALEKTYLYKKTKAMRGTHGVGIYSKYPITSVDYLEYRKDRPYCQVVTLDILGRKVRLFNAHLASPGAAVEHPENFYSLFGDSYHLRKKQVEDIENLLSDSKFPIEILAGDLNTTKYEPLYRQLKTNWENPAESQSKGSAKNFPNSSKSKPLITLDYVLLRGAISGYESEVIPGGSSDHMAVLCKVTL